MRITKFGHACVRLEHDGRSIVLDPGMFTDPSAVDGAGAVLITHEHPDHYVPDLLRRTDAPVFTIAAVAERIREDAPDVFERVTVVAPGESFDPGIPVRVVGELHAVIHPEMPRFFNSGYVVTGDLTVYHPGDSLTMPDEDIDVLLVPSSAPWLKASRGRRLRPRGQGAAQRGHPRPDLHRGRARDPRGSHERVPACCGAELRPAGGWCRPLSPARN